MTSAFVQDGDTLTVAAPYAVTAGMGVLVGNIFGVALHAAANGAPVEIRREGVFTLAKTSALAISVGDRVFFDASNKVVNKTTTSQVCVGVAVSAAVNPSSTVNVSIIGTVGTPSGT